MNAEPNLTVRTTGLSQPALPGAPGTSTMPSDTYRRTIVIRNPQGFHMRPAAALAEAARRFQSQATVIHGDRRGNARDILSLLMLLAGFGSEVTLEVRGPDAAEAVEVLAAILGAEEPPDPVPPTPVPKKG
jgi:phosphotransferase system HPr (HPr) family protein